MPIYRQFTNLPPNYCHFPMSFSCLDRYFPSNLEVIDWLGSYFIEMQVSENIVA